MTLYGLICPDVPLSNYSLTHLVPRTQRTESVPCYTYVGGPYCTPVGECKHPILRV